MVHLLTTFLSSADDEIVITVLKVEFVVINHVILSLKLIFNLRI